MLEPNAQTDAPPTPGPRELQELSRLINGFIVSQAIAVMAQLGIADLLATASQTAEHLAATTGTHALSLFRLLRLLSGVGLVQEVAPRRFALTPLGAGLCTDVPGSRRAFARYRLAGFQWLPWGQLLHSVQTGEPAFRIVHGTDFFEHLDSHPDATELYQQAMTANAALAALADTAITQHYEWSGVRRVVDVGGGQGGLLARLLSAQPTMLGVLFDRPTVLEDAPPVLAAAGVAARCEIVAGDFFAEVPRGGDVYILREILHDWDDEQALAILTRCRAAMAKEARLLVMEQPLGADYQAALHRLVVDVQMLVQFGGRERTVPEYEVLFAAAGLRLARTMPLGEAGMSGNTLLEAVPA